MKQKLSVQKIREIKNQCSVCGKYFITRIFPNKTYKGGNCFHSLDSQDKTEDWECDKCWGIELVQLHPKELVFKDVLKS